MPELIDFFKSKIFFKNLFFAVLVVVAFFWGCITFLSWYTRHGQYTVLPNLNKISLVKAEKTLKVLHLNYIIIDSSYNEHLPEHTVVNQNPYAGARVKQGRNIYLYITTTVPPKIEMPDLVDKSLREAKGMLSIHGLKLGKLSYKPDPCVGCILQQLYKGRVIAADSLISKGSVIDLVVGNGEIPGMGDSNSN